MAARLGPATLMESCMADETLHFDPPTLPAPGRFLDVSALAEAATTALGLEERHRKLIDALEAGIAKETEGAAASAARAGWHKVSAENAGKKMGERHRSAVRASSEESRYTILRALDQLAKGLGATDALWASPTIALARHGLGEARRTNLVAQLAGAGPAELKTAAVLAISTSDTVLGAAVAALLDRIPRRERTASPQELAERLVGEETRKARAAVLTIRQAQQRALNADREFASGRRNGTARIASALAQRDVEALAGAEA